MSLFRKVINRMRPGEDIGLDHVGQRGRQRTINSDGSYNMVRKTGRLLGDFYPYHWLITTNWLNFWLFALVFYGVMNLIFATVYFAIGINSLGGVVPGTAWHNFMYCFFFSAQSYTTVGYGGIHPTGTLSNIVASMEAFTGLMTFAIATGTLYGRFSRPVSKIRYSPNIIIAPFKNITGMQFMVANETVSTLMEMEAQVNLSWIEDEGNGSSIRRFQQVQLEVSKITMFPTSWTINHPIDEESALYGKSVEELQKMDFEVFILLRGFDDVFSQTIYSRHSYTAQQFIYGARFKRPFTVNENGKIVMDLQKVGTYDRAVLPQLQSVS